MLNGGDFSVSAHSVHLTQTKCNLYNTFKKKYFDLMIMNL